MTASIEIIAAVNKKISIAILSKNLFLCMDVSHSVFLYVNQIFSPTEPKLFEIRQAFASF